jgi:glutaconate CoA-transferase subunit A
LRALQAAGMGVPFLPVKGILGSAYLEVNPNFKVIPDPFGAGDLVAVRALRPDLTLVHGAKGDDYGNLLIPRTSDWALAIKASRRTVATVEEQVAGPLKDDADWRLIPAIHLTALVHCPGGAGPTGYPGYYEMDKKHIKGYLQSSQDPAAFEGYLREQVFGRKD